MDAFFASVAVRDDPALAGLPVAVCHSAGEISSCTYEARKSGVRAGMFVREARKICPDLRTVAYDFNAYETVSIQIYSRFFQYPHIGVEAVSVDEAYLDLSLSCSQDGARNAVAEANHEPPSQSSVEALVSDLRARIFADTKCTASAGIGPSKLVARLATKAAKPNGQFRVRQEDVISYVDTLTIRDLPGIGRRTAKRFDQLGVCTVPQLRAMHLSTLQSEFGDRQGSVFHDLARAIDRRVVEPLKPRKSIGAEVSWGVRFLKSEREKASKFITDICDEVALRVTAAGAYGTKVTYKVYKKVPNASMAGFKFLGHGPCTILTRSGRISQHAVGVALKSALRDVCLGIQADIQMEYDELRGIGIQVGDLTFADLKFDHASMPVAGVRRIETFFTSSNAAKVASRLSLTNHCNENNTNRVVPNKSSVRSNVTGSQHTIVQGNALEKNCDVISKSEAPSTENVHSCDDECIEKGPVTVVVDAEKEEERSDGEDHIEKGRAGDDDVVVKISSQTGDSVTSVLDNATTIDVVKILSNDIDNGNIAEIPDGWDSSVFKQLPKELREELLKESSNINALNEAGRAVQDDNSRSTIIGERRKKRGAGNESMTTALVNERNGKRKKQAAQVTMTQCVDILKVRKTGTEVLNATEFRGRPLHECVELLADLKGPVGLGGNRGLNDHKTATSRNDDAEERTNNEVSTEIPSPPNLSSDSEGSGNLEQTVQKHAQRGAEVYADEAVWEYAGELKDWMECMGEDIKSTHVELVRGRLMELLRSKRFERMCEDIRVVRLFALREECAAWIPWYNRLISEVQNECMRLYKFRLSVFRIKEN